MDYKQRAAQQLRLPRSAGYRIVHSKLHLVVLTVLYLQGRVKAAMITIAVANLTRLVTTSKLHGCTSTVTTRRTALRGTAIIHCSYECSLSFRFSTSSDKPRY